MNLIFELFKDIRNSGMVLKHRDMSGCRPIPNLSLSFRFELIPPRGGVGEICYDQWGEGQS